MSDVYRIQTSMTLAGNLVPEMTRLLKTLSEVDSKTKSVEKSFGRWVSPLNRAASAAGQLNRELSKSSSAGQKIEREVAWISRAMSGLKGGNGLDKEMQRWANAIGKPIAEMRVMRRETQGVASAAGWPALQSETVARKAAGDSPLLETGAMRDAPGSSSRNRF